MDLNETICFCADVTAGDIKKAYDEGHTTVDAIGEATEAGTHCGGCQDRIADLQNNSRQVKALAAHSSRTHLIGMEI